MGNKFSYTKSNRENAVQISSFEILPKGAYVCKILKAAEVKNKNGNGSHIEIGFDIAEGDYKDFYKKQFDANTNEDKKWPNDARYNLNVPDDESPEWMIQQCWRGCWGLQSVTMPAMPLLVGAQSDIDYIHVGVSAVVIY